MWGYYNPGLLPGVIEIWRLTAPALIIVIATVVSRMNVYFAPCQIKNFYKGMSNINKRSKLIPKTRYGISHEDRQRGLFAETHAVMNTVMGLGVSISTGGMRGLTDREHISLSNCLVSLWPVGRTGRKFSRRRTRATGSKPLRGFLIYDDIFRGSES